jgi:hypothetical protein
MVQKGWNVRRKRNMRRSARASQPQQVCALKFICCEVVKDTLLSRVTSLESLVRPALASAHRWLTTGKRDAPVQTHDTGNPVMYHSFDGTVSTQHDRQQVDSEPRIHFLHTVSVHTDDDTKPSTSSKATIENLKHTPVFTQTSAVLSRLLAKSIHSPSTETTSTAPRSQSGQQQLQHQPRHKHQQQFVRYYTVNA